MWRVWYIDVNLNSIDFVCAVVYIYGEDNKTFLFVNLWLYYTWRFSRFFITFNFLLFLYRAQIEQVIALKWSNVISYRIVFAHYWLQFQQDILNIFLLPQHCKGYLDILYKFPFESFCKTQDHKKLKPKRISVNIANKI